LARVSDTRRNGVPAGAEAFDFFLRSDRYEADRDVAGSVFSFELAQLREWFREERSTDVTQPNDQGREREAQRSDRGRHGVARLKGY